MAILAAAASGCAVSNTQVVRVRSVPPGAHVWLDGEAAGVAPVDVVVCKCNAEPVLRVEKDGLRPAERTLPRDISDRDVVDLALVGLAGHGTYFGLGSGGVPPWAAGAAVVGWMTFGLARAIRSGELYSFPEEIEVSLTAVRGTPDSAGPGDASGRGLGADFDLLHLGSPFELGRGTGAVRLRDRLHALRMGADDDGESAVSAVPEGRR